MSDNPQKLDAKKVRENISVVPFLGGVQIEFHTCGWDFEMSFMSDGRLADLSMEPASEREARR